MTRRFCLTLDLKDDPALIAPNSANSTKTSGPKIIQSLGYSDIEDMQIYFRATHWKQDWRFSKSWSKGRRANEFLVPLWDNARQEGAQAARFAGRSTRLTSRLQK